MEDRIEKTLSAMTLEQKCALLTGDSAFGTRAFPGLGVPALEFSDGPHGMRHQAAGANHLGIGGSEPATCFPTAVTAANTWNPEVCEELGRALAEEAASMGVAVVLGPGLNIKRSPLCGRDFEYFSEDPYLSGKMAAGYVRGIQENGLSACPKHYAVNSQETRRQSSDSVVDERTLREIYLSGFEAVVKESHPMTIMTSYNLVNGEYANENKHILKELLRDEFGFDGAIVTDWGGSNSHVGGVQAGSTFEMPAPGLDSVRELIDAVRAGELDEADVDTCVRDALRLIFSTRPTLDAATPGFDIDAHHEIARKVAAEGIVLLKNDADEAGKKLLPLAEGTKVALIGDFAETPRYQGAGSSLVNTTKLDTLLGRIGDTSLELVGFEPGFERLGGEAPSKLAAAVELAKRADVALVCLGLSEAAESEGIDRFSYELDKNQTGLLAAVAEVNPNVVVLLSAGSSIATDWADNCKALVYLALGGQAGATAALDVLTGAVNPSGKLAETWAYKLSDTPTASRFPSEVPMAQYREAIYVGYRYYQTRGVPVAYPFGYGLSYTTFAYSDMSAAPDGKSVSFVVTNTGDVAGAEICQLYVSKPEHEVFRAKQELKAFKKVFLEPGESMTVTLELDDRSYAYFNVKTNAWEIEGGTYELLVGASCEDIRLRANVELAGTSAPNPYEGLSIEPYETADIQDPSDAAFSAILGRDASDNGKIPIDRRLCFRDLSHGRSPLFWLGGAIMGALERGAVKKGAPNLNVEFIYNMPLRSMAKFAPFVSMDMVDSLVMEIKGFWIIGLLRFLIGLPVNLSKNSGLAKKLAELDSAQMAKAAQAAQTEEE